MRNLIFITIIFFLIFVLYKKDFLSNFTKSSFDKKITKIQIENLKNLAPKLVLNSIYLKEGDYFWKFNPKKLRKDLEKINEIENYNFSLKKSGILNIFIIEKSLL